MTDTPFQYDESLLTSCALESQDDNLVKTIPSCMTLYEAYLQHYSRITPDKNDHDEDFLVRYAKFVESVMFVHNHNSNGAKKKHKVTLNRFSNVPSQELPLLQRVPEKKEHHLEYMHGMLWDHSWTATELWGGAGSNNDNNNRGEYKYMVDEKGMPTVPPFVKLANEEDILHAASVMQSGASTLQEEEEATQNSMFNPLFLRHSYSFSHHDDNRVKKKLKGTRHTKTSAMDFWGGDCHDCDFDKHLDWSTKVNPDGVGIVQPVMDQGTCGACWAIAATGTVEASASRTSARDAFVNYMPSSKSAPPLPIHPPSPPPPPPSSDENNNTDDNNNNSYNTNDNTNNSGNDFNVPQYEDETINSSAIKAAQEAEREALSIAHLSVQELLDCDTNFDQGCTGGNPLLAFFFIRRYGLTTASSYPYVGKMELCQVEKVTHPVASVQNWGILTPNHEDNMELVLRYLGPIAVGVYGGDPAFLSYMGGIFDSETCTEDADHAMLIVGYGEEKDEYGETVKYWIARNSWGEGWGEKGYVRMKRGSGKKGHGGVCGIARSPSVALGGVLLVRRGEGGKLVELGRSRTAATTTTTTAASVEEEQHSEVNIKNSPFCRRNHETWIVAKEEGVEGEENDVEKGIAAGSSLWDGLRNEYCTAVAYLDNNVSFDMKSHDAKVAFGSILLVVTAISLWVYKKWSWRTHSSQNIGGSRRNDVQVGESSRLLGNSQNTRYDFS